MATDLFNNSGNNYANPGFSPCVGSADSNFFEFLKNGVGITSGSDVLSEIDYSNIKIPVSSWSQQIRIVNPGEVTFIQGLSKILLSKQQGFTMPVLASTDDTLNKFFMDIDLSINYYEGFGYKGSNIDTSSNYATSLGIDDAITLDLYNKNIGVTSTYSESIMYFNGSVAGTEFDVTNVTLTIVDASENADSPFAANVVNGVRQQITYDLVLDPLYNVNSAKHINTASQGIVIKNVYPTEYAGAEISKYDKWVYLNHTIDDVILYEAIDLTFLVDSSTEFVVIFDGSALFDYFPLLSKPSIMSDISINDVSTSITFNVSDSSVQNQLDVSIFVDASIVVDASLSYYEFTDSSIATTSISFSNIIDSFNISDSSIYNTSVDTSDGTIRLNFQDSYASASYIKDASIYNVNIIDCSVIDVSITDSSIVNSHLNTVKLTDTPTTNTKILNGDIIGGNHSAMTADGSGGLNTMYNLTVSDVSVVTYIIDDVSVVGTNSLLQDSSIGNISIATLSGGITHTFFDSSIHNSNNLRESNFIYSRLYNCDISIGYFNHSTVNDSIIFDASIRNSVINDSSIDLTFIQDSSIFGSTILDGNISGILENVDATNCNITNNSINGGNLVTTTVNDDSSIFGVIINNDSSIGGSIIKNSWVNTYELLASTDASGNNSYLYVMQDPTLLIDSSSWRVNIRNSEIWDCSINNANVYDCSIYTGYIQDSSLFRCVVYNNDIDRTTVDADVTTVMIDASIVSTSEIQTDVSTYYKKLIKTLDVGLNGSSTDRIISAGDYLEHVTDNNLWNKIGELYMWTSAPDSGVYNEVNLINGFYLYNPHTFPISAEYLVIV
jgi:uncharacterized protein YjbI with pentapeptide repeats